MLLPPGFSVKHVAKDEKEREFKKVKGSHFVPVIRFSTFLSDNKLKLFQQLSCSHEAHIFSVMVVFSAPSIGDLGVRKASA